jgi:hypothetical protein
MINAATAVAARIVKNQYNRFPRRRKGLAARGFFGAAAWLDLARAVGAPARRLGEIQGKIVWAWRLFSTPERPYNTSATIATKTSSRKPILVPQRLEVDLVPTALRPVEPCRRLPTSVQREHNTIRQWYDTSPGRQ